MDINHRSAVSLARRVVDPLAELCKIEPESLGVGMYQHDIEKNVLSNELKKCVESCVATVGVDLTTCSASLLQYVPGIGPAKAKTIVDYRGQQANQRKIGVLNKKDLRKVKGIGEKLLKQAAGFVYISNAPKLVDRVAHIHPDTLPIIEFMQETFGGETVPEIDIDNNDVHLATILSFIDERGQNHSKPTTKSKKRGRDEGGENQLNCNSNSSLGEDTAAEFYNIEIVRDVIKELQGKVPDVRKSQPKPLTIDIDKKQKRVEDVNDGDIFMGTVRNIVQFGAFIDISVGADGLLHSSQLKRLPVPLKINQTVKVKVISKELRGNKYRIALGIA